MRYARPSSLEKAIELITEAKGTAFVLAGGSDLLVRMKGGYVEPDLIVDIKAIAGTERDQADRRRLLDRSSGPLCGDGRDRGAERRLARRR